MAFWRFGFAQDSAIDTLLKGWEASNASASETKPESSASLDIDAARPGRSTTASTLELLLEEDDLLQECKSQHVKLVRNDIDIPLVSYTERCYQCRWNSSRVLKQSSGCLLISQARHLKSSGQLRAIAQNYGRHQF